jgi:hypothetical protein
MPSNIDISVIFDRFDEQLQPLGVALETGSGRICDAIDVDRGKEVDLWPA